MRTARTIGLALAGLLLAVACARESDSEPEGAQSARSEVGEREGPVAGKQAGRVLLVGIDGATLRIARPLLEAGRLPHLASIASAGVYGPLRAHYPIESPRIWTSIATGMRPEVHGIIGFAHEEADGSSKLYGSRDRRVPALWTIASAAGLSVAVVNWWNTFPVEKVRGVLVSDHLLAMDVRGRQRLSGLPDEPTSGTIAWPEEWDARSRGLLADDTPVVEVPDPFADTGSFPSWVRPERLTLRYENDADVVRVALAVEAQTRPDLMLVFLPGIDRVSHVVWASVAKPEAYPHPPAMTPEQRAATAEALRGYYVYTDALIGRLLERYDASDLVLVVSDHGFEAGGGLGFLTGAHHSQRAVDGVVFARGPGIGAPPPAKRPRISVNDVTPTVLTWLGLPLGADMDGHPAPFLLEPEPTWIPTHAGLRIEHLDAGPSGGEEEILDHLRALGYLEADGQVDATGAVAPEEGADSH